jgi:hypothetical protein
MTEFFKDGYKNLMDMCGIKKCLKKPFNPLDVIMEIEGYLNKKAKLFNWSFTVAILKVINH